jgi:hypothetical protein
MTYDTHIHIHKLENTIALGQGKKYPETPFKVCDPHKEHNETRYICKFCAVRFTKVLDLRTGTSLSEALF